jgi:hypothetical protein
LDERIKEAIKSNARASVESFLTSLNALSEQEHRF